jgi:glycosyltransferase involved in cell wall biosynthesis
VTSNSNTLSVTVVIPAYNEEANIARLARQVLAEPWDATLVLDKLLIVDDCSDDRTREITQRLASEDGRVKVIRHGQRGGKILASAMG